jgi:ferrochelatase
LTKLAVVLFNLGGPDGPDAVKPFLENLFKDPAIISLPAIARIPLAKFIAARRAEMAKANYAIMGGGSPLLPETVKQASALEASLAQADPSRETRVFIAMRYWKPFAAETAKQVAAFAPDEIVLLPLYPQFSTTTTGSSLKDWAQAYRGSGRTRTVCCYPTEPGLTDAHARLIRQTWEAAGSPANVRLLFSAHGLPQKTIARGDPYRWQVEQTAAAIVARLGVAGLDWSICYQSRVGPVEWIGPSIEAELARAGRDRVAVIVAPIAFVSEHVETLVELDETMKALADARGVPRYVRVPTLRTDARFIGALAAFTVFLRDRPSPCAAAGHRICPASFAACPMRAGDVRARETGTAG